ncbi:MAG: hypothetical protein KatS3mg015_2830 [Fimbriimonadales bacterium]|nr:MAG: hypothetical protein KatS3mg015_2830 [Fimbriimonadales bacterium]
MSGVSEREQILDVVLEFHQDVNTSRSLIPPGVGGG